MRIGIFVALLFSAITLASYARAGACRDERGDANLLVDQCTEVSPATHPPCNAANPCALIVSEIRRGCALLSGSDRPKFCFAYSD